MTKKVVDILINTALETELKSVIEIVIKIVVERVIKIVQDIVCSTNNNEHVVVNLVATVKL